MTALGDLEGRAAVTRAGARPGDVVAIAGELGLSARGLSILFDRFRVDGAPVPVDASQLDDDEAAALAAQLRPAPPIGLGSAAATAGATAMMDVSDRLVLDAGRLADASGVTVSFDASVFPSDPALALGGGEDHALLATFPAGALPPGFRAIGEVLPRGAAPVLFDGRPTDAAGWDPYRDWDAVSG